MLRTWTDAEWTCEHEVGWGAARAARKRERREKRWVHVQRRRRDLDIDPRDYDRCCEMCGNEPCLCHLLPDDGTAHE